MLSNSEPWLQVCEVLAEQENLKVTVRESAKGALTSGAGALLGGLLGGPVGIAIGGTLGSLYSACRCQSFRPVVDILRNDLTPQQKIILSNTVSAIARNINMVDVAMLITTVMSNASMKEAIIQEIASFMMRELNLRLA